jgi:hypothetical protein
MGASIVTTASSDALNNINKVKEESTKPNTTSPPPECPMHADNKDKAPTTHEQYNLNQSVSPPPECPMHAENKAKSVLSNECPIGGEKNDINMLNMVCYFKIQKSLIKIIISIKKRCHQQINYLLQINHFLCQLIV